MNRILSRMIAISAVAFLSVAHADHMSIWGAGWASMPNDIHNTRFDTRLLEDDAAFRDFVRYGVGADSTNRFLIEEATVLESELMSGHQVDQLSARLDPLKEFLGGGWAKYTLFDGDTQVSRVLNISIRLRLVRRNGSLANEGLGLTADNAPYATVTAYFRRYDSSDYAWCSLDFDGVVLGDDDVPEYATFALSLKESQSDATIVDGIGSCVTDASLIPDVHPLDVVEVGVATPAIIEEVRPVLAGGF